MNAPATFVSYCRADGEFVLKLVEDLKAAGANVWLDQLDIPPGMLWDDAVEKALFQCPSMLVILSTVSVSSGNVRDEVSFALGRQKRIIPVLYQDCDIPFRLARLQHIDFRTNYDRAFRLLQTALVQPQTGIAPTVEPEVAPFGDFPSGAGEDRRLSSSDTTTGYPKAPVQPENWAHNSRFTDNPLPAPPPKFEPRLVNRFSHFPINLKIIICALLSAFLPALLIGTANSVESHIAGWVVNTAYVSLTALFLSVQLLWLKPGWKPGHVILTTFAWFSLSLAERLVVWQSGSARWFTLDLAPGNLKVALTWAVYGLILGIVLAAALRRSRLLGFATGFIVFAVGGVLRGWALQVVYEVFAEHGPRFLRWFYIVNIAAWTLAVGVFLWVTRRWE